VERSGLTIVNNSDKKSNRRMTKAPIGLQDLRKRIYIKAKAEPEWRFWGLYVHVCKLETLQEAYLMAKSNDGAPGIDGVTFAPLKKAKWESFYCRYGMSWLRSGSRQALAEIIQTHERK